MFFFSNIIHVLNALIKNSIKNVIENDEKIEKIMLTKRNDNWGIILYSWNGRKQQTTLVEHFFFQACIY